MTILMLIGFPASGKSTIAEKYKKDGYTIVSRDTLKPNSTINSLEPILTDMLKEDSNKNIVLDNTHLTVKQREGFIKIAKQFKTQIVAIVIKTTIEYCQLRVLHRQYEKYGRLFMTVNEKNEHPEAKKDSCVFPPAVLFKARKEYIEPTIEEGFDSIVIIKANDDNKQIWNPRIYKNKAIFFDIDGTLRIMTNKDSKEKYPTTLDEVKLIHPSNVIKEKLLKYIEDGYMIFGISNQSGIAKGVFTEELANQIMDKTRDMIGLTKEQFPISICPHRSNPISCYCRKPQSGQGVRFIEKYKLDTSKSIMVGDLTTDKTFAKRLDIKYIDVKDFW